MNAVTIVNAHKFYKNVHALRGVNLTVKMGEFFGLLGPNGAGKTTLIQSVVGLCRLSQGSITVFGHDSVGDYLKAHQLIGYAPQEVNLERYFSIQKTLEYQAGYFGVPKKDQKPVTLSLLKQFGIAHKAGAQFYKLSGGMQKRALIAKALVNKPQLLILDEPTAGVDVEQRHELWDYLKHLNANGTTIILTTHYIDEAELLCERIGIINLGEIRELGSPKKLIEKYCTARVIIALNQNIEPSRVSGLTKFRVEVDQNKITATGERVGVMIEEILKIVIALPHLTVQDVSVDKGTLEEVFLRTTGKTFAEMETNNVKEQAAIPAESVVT